MSIRVAIRHITTYRYEKAIQVYPQVIRLRPAPHTRTPIISYTQRISPENHFINWQQDPFGNYLARVVFQDLVRELKIDVEIIADLVTYNPFDFFLEDYAEKFPFEYDLQLKKELAPYLETEEYGSLFQELHREGLQYREDHTVNFLVNINQLVYKKIQYVIRLEPGIQSCEETLEKRLGSCRDSAWLLVHLCRSYGLAARFVSGYIVQLRPDEQVIDGPNGPEEDFTDLHAWAEVYIPGAGWIGLDATSGLFAGEGHIPLACTPDPASAAPLTGYTAPVQSTMEYVNQVRRIHNNARVTAPYEEQELNQILELGDRVEEILQNEDVRLSMGGEPTFVSDRDMESKQWNEDADGRDKRKIAWNLAQNLMRRWAPGGLIHNGQGKWYPGEAIPRWQYATYWRKDELPIWQRPSLLSNPTEIGKSTKEELNTFANLLVQCLGLPEICVHRAFEDRYYYLWEKENLPVNRSVPEIGPEDGIIRQTMAEILEMDSEQPAGLVIPLQWNYDQQQWQSCLWEMRRNKLFLIPGNSDMGYRLPLDRLPHTSEPIHALAMMPDNFAVLPDLPHPGEKSLRSEQLQILPTSLKETTIRTAMCLQIKGGHLTVFLPPFDTIEPFLKLVGALEYTAETLNIPVVLEGYQPPYDSRIEKLVIAPDPGVIEVNIHPSLRWRELVIKYQVLFEEARKSGLGTQKFMLDGKHSGTSGGNHITLGGIKPSESPLLRNPGLLRSLVSFWINHPSLSYLFSSPFIGMTSQAPRVDEGKPDAIYNLELAFREIDKYADPPFWLVDRLFRNILTDITGNTHRSEFCIDKLYSPDSPTGRLGILELRGFDMPPHRDMCLVQLLLIRSLVAALWRKPYRFPLVRWGSQLHDRFMISHYIRKDMDEVLHYLHEQKISFPMKWLEPFFEFRFPLLGQYKLDDMELQIRAGIEPWNVLGEEMSSTGTARFVDSSMERLEVILDHFQDRRYRLLCNQVVVPLVQTSVPGRFVGSIRYKAWAPPSALHPTKKVNTPLVFDIFDAWNGLSVGGCTYHVMHPGGRNYETYPVNAFEAEGRRISRFFTENHTPSPVEVRHTQEVRSGSQRYVTVAKAEPHPLVPKEIERSGDYFITLDLQQAD